jgi:hypothetical protein
MGAYIMGKGYLSTAERVVPEKYCNIKLQGGN